MEISRVNVAQVRGLWRLAFYEGYRVVYDEYFQTLDAALFLAPRIFRERFGDDSKPSRDYYERGRIDEHAISDTNL